MKDQEALECLMNMEGYDEGDIGGFILLCTDSVNPGICTDCGHIMDIEPDVSKGLCRDCGHYKVISGTMLLMSCV